MTNVPQKIRDLWSDIYVLFDRNYLMPNTQDAWDSFWKQAMEINLKYENCPYLFKMIDMVTTIIEDRMHMEQKPPERPCSLEDMNLF